MFFMKLLSNGVMNDICKYIMRRPVLLNNKIDKLTIWGEPDGIDYAIALKPITEEEIRRVKYTAYSSDDLFELEVYTNMFTPPDFIMNLQKKLRKYYNVYIEKINDIELAFGNLNTPTKIKNIIQDEVHQVNRIHLMSSGRVINERYKPNKLPKFLEWSTDVSRYYKDLEQLDKAIYKLF